MRFIFRFLFTVGGIVPAMVLHAQAGLNTIGTPYTQNFNSLPNSTDGVAVFGWANNTFLTGWYVNSIPVVEATCGPTAASINNGGGIYVIASGSDRNLGSRASGSSAILHYGLRLVNSTGSTINSLYIVYYTEQWSIAENGSNINTNTFSYRTGTTVTSLTTGVWTSAASLNSTQLYTSSQSLAMGGTACAGTSNQCLAIDGNVAANRTRVEACITVSIPAGQEIMLRWSDADDPSNDHHLQIDDLEVWPFIIPCSTILPVELTLFTAEISTSKPLLYWETAIEQNNDRFEIERSRDAEVFEKIGTVHGSGTTSQPRSYSFSDATAPAGINYYRLKQIDYNGQYSYSPIRALEVQHSSEKEYRLTIHSEGISYLFNSTAMPDCIEVWNASGMLLFELKHPPESGSILLQQRGLYFIRIISGNASTVATEKVVF
jgi:hypothetical protein